MSAMKRLASLCVLLIIVSNALVTAYGDDISDKSQNNNDLDCQVPFEVVETTDDLYNTTADVVVVLSDDSVYGDGKGCVFQKMEARKFGFPREDGSRMYPLPDQGSLKTPDADYEQIMRIVKSYCGRNTLVYGRNTLYSANCENGIDCSSFVSAILHNIDYSHSRYHLGTDQQNVIGNHPIMLIERIENIGWRRLVTYQMAQYFAEQKRLFSFSEDTAQSAVEKLSFGDILFFSYDEDILSGVNERYYNIGHVAIVLGTIPNDNCVIIAQGGGSPKKLTLFNNEKTAVKTSVLKITEDALKTQMKFFARPNYSGDIENNVTDISGDDGSVFEPRFQINTRIDLNDGDFYLSTNSASSADYYPAEPGAILGHSGEEYFNGAEVEHYIAEYDGDYSFLRLSEVEDTIPLLDETRYVRFMCSLSDLSVPFTLDFTDHLGCFSYR